MKQGAIRILVILMLAAAPMGASAVLNSASYRIDDENFSFGVGVATSTTYSLDIDLGNQDVGGVYNPPGEGGGGGGFGPPPAPAPPPPPPPDESPPASVSDFAASGRDRAMFLSWNNPADPDFADVIIRRRADAFPESPSDGALVYQGSGESALDGGLAADAEYFYTAFARDAAGNISSGALARGRTLPTAEEPPPAPLPEEPPVPEPAPEPTEEPPPPGEAPPGEALPPPGAPVVESSGPAVPIPGVSVGAGERLGIGDIIFYVGGRRLRAAPISGEISVFPRGALGITVPASALYRPARSIILNVGDASYLFAEHPATQTWDADVEAPGVIGAVPSAAIITYETGETDVVSFIISVRGFGRALPTSEIILLSGDGRDAHGRMTAADDGSFGFLVVPGRYIIRAEKEGYFTAETAPLTIRDNLAVATFHLLSLPPPLTAKPSDIAANVSFAVRAAPQALRRAFNNPVVQQTNRAAAPTLVAVGAANVAAAVPMLSLFAYLRYLVASPLLLLERRRRKQWGVVYHALTKLPVDLAIVRLIDLSQNRIAQTRVTDREGRFFIIARPGTYRIEVVKLGFTYPTAFLRARASDTDYLDLYHGETIAVRTHGTQITPNIPLDPDERMEAPRAVRRRVFIQLIQAGIAGVGVALSFLALIATPTWYTTAFFIAQIALFFVFRRIARGPRPKGWGIIYDAGTRAPLRYAVARLFDTEFNKLIETRVTDASGKYNFLVGRNKYRVVVDRGGYAAKELPVDATAEKRQIIKMNVGLTKAEKTVDKQKV